MKKVLTFVWLTLAIAALAACGGGEEEPSAGGELPTTLDFLGVDIAFEPKSATVASGETITVNFTNNGALEHNWLLVAPGIEPVDATEADSLGGATTGLQQPGEAATITFTAPPVGHYTIVCTVQGHVESGMVATLNVQYAHFSERVKRPATLGRPLFDPG
jgi:plastocyanin